MSMSMECPVWYDRLAPLGSAVRYVASLSPEIRWVGIYKSRGGTLVLGPQLGAPDVRPGQKRIPIGKATDLHLVRKGTEGKVVGALSVQLDERGGHKLELEENIRRIAGELGNLWPA